MPLVEDGQIPGPSRSFVQNPPIPRTSTTIRKPFVPMTANTSRSVPPKPNPMPEPGRCMTTVVYSAMRAGIRELNRTITLGISSENLGGCLYYLTKIKGLVDLGERVALEDSVEHGHKHHCKQYCQIRKESCPHCAQLEAEKDNDVIWIDKDSSPEAVDLE